MYDSSNELKTDALKIFFIFFLFFWKIDRIVSK